MEIRPTAPLAQQAAPVVLADKAAPPPTAAAVPRADAIAPGQLVPTESQLSQAVMNINHALQARSQDLEFSIDPDSARTIVTVTDKNTHEVIRQMPTKEAMEISKALEHLQSLLTKQTA